ncbi:YceD family protein [Halovulum sp. GXIMD14793]
MKAATMDPDTPAPLCEDLKLTDKDRNSELSFDLQPTAEDCAAIADFLQIPGVAKLRFGGKIKPHGDGWQLRGQLGATVTQACVVTLAPVKARIDTAVHRRYLPMPDDEAMDLELDPEAEEDLEPLRDSIDLGALLTEELALALPPYPRVPEADLTAFAEAEGIQLDAEKENPFAALAALRDTPGDKPQ